MRALGAVLIIASCTAIGLLMSLALKNHAMAIESFINALDIFKAEICVRKSSLGMAANITAKNAQGIAANFFAEASMAESGSFLQEFEKLLQKPQNYNLIKRECDELLKLKAVLGRFDCQTQKIAIEDCIARLNIALKIAEEKKKSTGKLMKTAGISLGIIIACMAL